MSELKQGVIEVIGSEKKHHRWGPSRLNYLDECAAFTNKDGTSDAAEEGTALHEAMESFVRLVATGKFKTTLEQVGPFCKLHELEHGNESALRFCCKRVDSFLAKGPEKILTELQVRVLNPDGTEFNHGTLDLLLVFKNAIGILIDYKFGGIPVRPAALNLQGFNYAVGAFQGLAGLTKICVEFIQPKLASISNHTFLRPHVDTLYTRIKAVVDQAIFVQANVESPDVQKFMKVGTYCKYCDLAGDCALLNSSRAVAVHKYEGLPVPKAFSGLKLKTPEDFAKARYFVQVIEEGFESLKAKAYEVAELNGGSIEFTHPGTGEVIRYEVAERSADRTLGSATEVAECLKECITESEVLGAAELKIGALEDIVKSAMVEMAKAQGQKLTKKAAWEDR